jgi:hypothetical protein
MPVGSGSASYRPDRNYLIPKNLLQGSGKCVRHIRLESAAVLDRPAAKALMAHALKRVAVPFNPAVPGRLIIKSVSAKQRPRRPKLARFRGDRQAAKTPACETAEHSYVKERY